MKKYYHIPDNDYLRIHFVRPRFKSNIENVLLYIANECCKIETCSCREYARILNFQPLTTSAQFNFKKKVELILHSTSLFQENYLSLQKVVRFLAEKPHEEGYGQRPRVVERAEFRGFRQMKISGLTRLAVR